MESTSQVCESMGEGVAPPLRYESPLALALAQSQWGHWGWRAGGGGPRGRAASCWLWQEPLPWLPCYWLCLSLSWLFWLWCPRSREDW